MKPVRRDLFPTQGVRSGSNEYIVVRVITLSPSTLLSVESASFARVVRPTSADRVCITSSIRGFLLTRFQVRATQGQGLMPDKTTRFTVKGQRVFHFVWPPLRVGNLTVLLTVVPIDGNLNVLPIHSCFRCLCRCH